MTSHIANSDAEPEGGATDIVDAEPGNWVDRLAPKPVRPYLRLARMDRPIGTWLLLFPCWWSLTLAEVSIGRPIPTRGRCCCSPSAPSSCAAQAAPTTTMSTASTTRGSSARRAARSLRPGLARGRAAVRRGSGARSGFLVLIWFNLFTILLGIGSLAIVAIYPFMKRFTYWPQAVLGARVQLGRADGLGLGQGLARAAADPALHRLGAMDDRLRHDLRASGHRGRPDARPEDRRRSRSATTRRPGSARFYAGALMFWILAGLLAGTHLVFFFGVALVGLQMAWQVSTLDTKNPENCLRRFRANRDVGAAIFLALLTDTLLSWWAGLS